MKFPRYDGLQAIWPLTGFQMSVTGNRFRRKQGFHNRIELLGRAA
jgi:hypothetical protein